MPTYNKGNLSVNLKQTTINTYKKLLALAGTVSVKMAAAVATFATPTPALADLDTAAGALKKAVQPQGHKHNKGSKAETLNAQAKANDVRQLLSQLVQYAYNTCLDLFPADSHNFNATLATAGLSMKLIRKPKRVQKATWARQMISKDFPSSSMTLNWRRPIGLIKGAPIAGYLIKADRAFQRLNTAGYQDVLFSPGFLPTDPTGLANTTDYSVIIIVDGVVNDVHFVGAAAPDFASLKVKIDGMLTGAHVEPFDSVTPNTILRVVSETTGTSSTIVFDAGSTPDFLWTALNGYASTGSPVAGTSTLIPVADATIASVTKTRWTYNPSYLPIDDLTGSIVPINSRGEGSPINFKLIYTS